MKVSARLLLDAIIFAVYHEKVQQKLNPIDAYSLFTAQSLSCSLDQISNGAYKLKIYFDYASLNNQVKDQDVEIDIIWSYPEGFSFDSIAIVERNSS